MKPTVGCGKRTARNASSRERVYRICRIGPCGRDQYHTARPGVKTLASSLVQADAEVRWRAVKEGIRT